ncbi:MAG: noncanonical pyrimidine nucleotidase, YjjG family [Flavobacteriaceae bacterium]|nr:MAG: noncanonical pyrimidine nucleotidase, YjjG family [Flavobacteriaceae bacterium]
MRKITDIFFDLDHTLWDFEANSKVAFESIFKKHALPINIEKFLNYYVPINFKFWKLYRDEKISQETLKFGRLKETFEIIKIQVSFDQIKALSSDYLIELPKSNTLFEGTHVLLQYLRAKGYNMHIITNGFEKVQIKKLENSNINEYFDQIITSESVGVKKPNPLVFNEALKMANVTATNAIMIGDNWEADIMGAKNAGLDVIYCNFNKQSVGNNIKSVNNLLEIKQFL